MNRRTFTIRQFLFVTAWLAFMTALAVYVHSGSRQGVIAAIDLARIAITFLMILAFADLATNLHSPNCRGQAIVYGIYCMSFVMPQAISLFVCQAISQLMTVGEPQPSGNILQIARIVDFGIVPIVAILVGFFSQIGKVSSPVSDPNDRCKRGGKLNEFSENFEEIR